MDCQPVNDLGAYRIAPLRLGYSRGWAFVPLDGKVPTQKEWTDKPRAPLQECERWARVGNVGMRTGSISGVVVIDVDDASILADLNLPKTVTVETGGGGYHLYFQAPDQRIGNSVSKLAKKVDVRGEGGQVVFPGSIHPDTGKMYRWVEGRSPKDIDLANLPDWVLAELGGGPEKGTGDSLTGAGTPYGLAALEAELEAVRSAAEGTRNNQLNKSAFALGQLVGGGQLDDQLVRDELLRATDLPTEEARATIDSGLRSGMNNPRQPPLPPVKPVDVLLPGTHLNSDGEILEVSEPAFVDAVLEAFPADLLYRRGQPAVAGRLLGEPGQQYFALLDAESMRILIGTYAKLVRWASKEGVQALKHVAVGPSYARLVLAGAATNKRVRDLELLVPYPMVGHVAGWNSDGVYLDLAPELQRCRPEMDKEVIHSELDDLLVDFPFADEASRESFIGLLLTPLLRLKIDGNVPLHLVHSSLERTGKTKLIEDVLGGTLLGAPTPAMQLSGSEEEIGKRIMGLLLRGKPIIHLDNVRGELDSPALASLLTAATYQGRVLGGNAMPELRNRTVLVASGNNVYMSGELAKRTVPILLQPRDDAPELRGDFKHPDLRDYVRRRRGQILGCLLGMVRRWEDQGRPAGDQRLGGFEEWARIVGGVMKANGFTAWLTNMREWQRQADPHGADLISFVEHWHREHGDSLVKSKDLYRLAQEQGLFLAEVRGSMESQQIGSFVRRVLSRHRETPVAGYKIVHERTRHGGFWRLLPSGQ